MRQTVVLEGGHPWGFRIGGGDDTGRAITITQVIFGSKAYNEGLRAGDVVKRINDEDAQRLTSSKANHFIRTAGQKLALELHKSSFKPSYTIPEIRITDETTTEINRPVNNNKDSSSVLYRPFGVSDEKREAGEDIRRRRSMLIAASGSPLAMMRKKPPVAAGAAAAGGAAGAMANGEEQPCPPDQEASGSNINIWSPFGKSSVSPLKTYKPVAFSPFSSSSPSTSLSSSLSSFSDTPVKSSSIGPSSSATQQTTSKVATASIMNGIVPDNEISTSVEASKENSINDSSSTQSSSLLFSPSSKDGRPVVSSSASDWKPTKPTTSTIMWKPPGAAAAAVEVKSSASHINTPSSSTPSDHRIKTVSFASKKNTPSESDSAATAMASGEWKPVQVVTTSSVRVGPPPTAEKPSADWKKFQVSDANSSDGFAKSAGPNGKTDAIDTTIFDRELTEDWWDSLFNEAQKAEAAAEAAALAAEAGGGGHRNDEDVSYSQKATTATDSEMAPLSSTAAVLRLSSSLGDAIQVATDAEHMANLNKPIAPTQQNRGPRKPVNNDILDEWRSGFCDKSKNSDQNDYDRLKEFHETRSQPSNHRRVLDGESRPSGMSDRMNGGGVSETTDMTTLQKRGTKDNAKKATTMNVNGLIPVKFEGIGPTEEKTGCPIATRVSIDEKNRKDWYRRMYASLNKPHRPPGKQTLLPNGDMKDQQRVKSPSPPGTSHSSYYPPHAKYNPDRYRNQPLRIEDYEPGYHCSIALKDQKSDPNRIFESDAEVDYRSEDLDQFARELRADLRENGLLENRSGTRKKGTSTINRSKSFNRQTARQKRDEENVKRKQELETVMAEERRRRFTVEQKENEARRHKDLYTPVQKTSFLLNRFGDDEIGGLTIQRPKQVKAIKMRGKAKALYTFKAQSNRELSFKKGDIIYLLRQLDRNWYQGEHNGIVGIFPIAYVEVITSLEEAKTMALQREGKAIAKFNFKAKTSAELSLQKGDVVRLVRKADQNWYEGRIGNRQGIFPINFVETVQEPDAPMMTPSPSSAAPTPMPETSGHLSPTSSLYSGGPDIPSAPISPWNSDFYESEFEPELRELTSKTQGQRPHSGNKSNNSVLNQKMESLTRKETPSTSQTRQTTYFTFPAQTDDAVVNAAPAALSEKSRKDMRNTHGEKDLYALARKRRATAGSALEARSASLGDDLEKIFGSANLEPLGKSLSFDLGPRDSFSKGTKSSSSSKYTVIYDYKPKNLDELELKEGDVVCVMEKCDDGWFVGYSETTSEFGTFPGNYVERLF